MRPLVPLLLLGACLLLLIGAALTLGPFGRDEGRGARAPSVPVEAPPLESGRTAGPAPASESGGRVSSVLLRGTVRAAGEDVPVPDVPVHAGRAETRTGPDGGFLLGDLEPGPIEVRVEPDYPFRPTEARAVVDAETGGALDVELVPSFTLEVQVLAREDPPAPVGGARIELARAVRWGEREAFEAPLHVRTDDVGRATLTDVPGGLHALRVDGGEGFLESETALPFSYRELELRRHLKRRAITVVLEPRGPTLSGRVFGPDRSPVAGAFVCVSPASEAELGRSSARRAPRDPTGPAPTSTWSDAEGAFELPLPARHGALVLTAVVDRHGLASVTRTAVAAADVGVEQLVGVRAAREIVLWVARTDGTPAGGALHVDDGRARHDLAGDPVLARVPGFAARSGAAGAEARARLRLPDGGYHVLFEPTGEEGSAKAFFVSVQAAGPSEIRLELDP